MHLEWTLLTIKVLEHEVIGLRSPTGIGARSARIRKLAIVASAINLLDVVPLSQLCIDSERTIVLYTNLILRRLLGRNQDNTMRSTATIEGTLGRIYDYKTSYILLTTKKKLPANMQGVQFLYINIILRTKSISLEIDLPRSFL